MKKIALLFSVIVVIVCMSLPVAAAAYKFKYTKVNTAYHNSTLENRGEMGIETLGRVRFKLSIANSSNEISRGTVTHTVNSSSWKYHVKYSGWVDRSYHCNVVVFDLA